MKDGLIRTLLASTLFLNGCKTNNSENRYVPNKKIDITNSTDTKKTNPLEGKIIYLLEYENRDIFLIDQDKDGKIEQMFEGINGEYKELKGKEKEEIEEYYQDCLTGRNLA